MLMGIVGKPSSGKSTFFRAATLAEAEIAQRPFTTIKPNRGVGYIKTRCACRDFGVTCNPRNSFCLDGWRFAPVEMLDVAGLVPDAHLGRGLGNQFLDDLRQADVFIHVVDASGRTDAEGRPTRGHDPLLDIEFLADEIDMWLVGLLKKKWREIVKRSELTRASFAEALSSQLSGLNINEEQIKRALLEKRLSEYKDADMKSFARALREAAKPMVIAANKIDLAEAEANIRRIEGVPCCAEAELALREAAEKGIIEYVPGGSFFKTVNKEGLNEKQRSALRFLEGFLGRWKDTGVQRCLNRAIELLGCVIVFPVEDENRLTDKDGNVLPDAIVMPRGSTALDLAYKIHQDIGKGFIRAIDCRTKKVVGKEYVLKDRDVIKVVSR